jgi:glycosyltransferase involved in cell wall biosynthesis
MKTILHISADFPDPMVPVKTKAVERLIAGTDGFRHVVYSLNRVNWRTDIAMLPFGEDRIALAYGAPPYGLRLRSHLLPVAEVIGADLRKRGIVPDLIHAHKFAVDGIVADKLSAATGAPFIASLWGDTDSKFFDSKPGLRAHYRDIARRAELLLPAAPWTGRYFAEALALEPARIQVLPVITPADAVLPPQLCGKRHVVTTFNWDAWHRKGFDTLLHALTLLGATGEEVCLDVFGRGGPKALLEMTRLIERFGLTATVRLMRPLDLSEVQSTMNRYAAFAMPSRRETYGMVYVEAVLAGVPILCSQNQGVDGLFEGMSVGYACNAQSVADVADGLRLLLIQESRLKDEIARLQQNGALEHIRSTAIAARYHALLTALTAAPYQAAVSAA